MATRTRRPDPFADPNRGPLVFLLATLESTVAQTAFILREGLAPVLFERDWDDIGTARRRAADRRWARQRGERTFQALLFNLQTHVAVMEGYVFHDERRAVEQAARRRSMALGRRGLA